MKRREYLTVTGAVIGISGCVGSLKEETCSIDGEEFGFLSPGFKSISWNNLNQLEVTFEEGHGMDAFGIRHEYHDEWRNDIISGEPPEFGGRKTVPLIRRIRNRNTVYPTRKFKLVAYEGVNGSPHVLEDTIGSVTFCIPTQIAPPGKFKDK